MTKKYATNVDIAFHAVSKTATFSADDCDILYIGRYSKYFGIIKPCLHCAAGLNSKQKCNTLHSNTVSVFSQLVAC